MEHVATTYDATLFRKISVTRLLLVSPTSAGSMDMLSYVDEESELWV